MNSIVTKLGLTILFTIMVILLPLGFVTNKIFLNFYYSQIYEEVDSLSSKYATITDIESKSTLEMFEKLADLTYKEIVVVDKKGSVLGNSGIRVMYKGSKINKVQYELLFNGASVEEEVTDPSSNERYLAIGKPVQQNGEFKGAIFVYASMSDMYVSLERFQDILLLAGAGALLIALGITFIVSKKLASPLLNMEEATRKISSGDYETRLIVHSKDEIGFLARAINDLSMEIKSVRDNRREFFANISHELKTPITYLEGYANVLKNNLVSSKEERDQYLDIIEKEAKRLSTLIDDLFELAKMEEGKIELELQEIDLKDLIKHVSTKSMIRVNKKGLSLKFMNEDEVPSVLGDGLRLEQIMTNLIENAIRYTEKGSITISLSTVRAVVKVKIKDTGPGIPKEDITHLFERFYRVEKSRSRNHGGTGLGLAIVKNLVELQGGTITVCSELGIGTTFELSLPQYKDDVENEAD
jgi:signal transduction histidine kinase